MRIKGNKIKLPTNQNSIVFSSSFNGTEDPLSEGGVWLDGGIIGIGGLNKNAGILTCPTTYLGLAYYGGAAIGKNQYAQIRVLDWHTSEAVSFNWVSLGPAVRIDENGGYGVFYSEGKLFISLYQGLGVGALDETKYVYQEITNGDILRLEIFNDVLTLRLNGRAILSQIDPDNYCPAGQPGIGYISLNTSPTADDFQCGELNSLRFNSKKRDFLSVNTTAGYLSRTTNIPSDPNAFTAMGWFYTGDGTDWNTCFTIYWDNGRWFYFGKSSSESLETYDGITQSGFYPLNLNTWYHLTIVIDGAGAGAQKFYVNGIFGGQTDNTAGGTPSSLTIAGGGYAAYNWNTQVCQVKIWDVALTEAEIRAEIRSWTPVKKTNLNSFYPLYNASEATIDRSGNGYNATLVGTLTNGTTFPSPY